MQWVYHVAPVIEVQGADGTISEKVVDPSLFHQPVSKAEWEHRQGSPPGAYEETSDPGAYFQNKKHHIRDQDPDGREASRQMRDHRANRDAARARARARMHKNGG